MKTNALDIRPLSGALGAEILGIDLAHDLATKRSRRSAPRGSSTSSSSFATRRSSPAQFLHVASRFGEPVEYPFVKGLDGFPQITPVIKLEHEKINFGGLWHSDTAYLERPPMATMLIARETPPRGGDTLFANMYLAYETLSDGMRRMLDGLVIGEFLRQGRRDQDARGPRARQRERPRRGRNTSPSIRWCARIRRPAARRSTPMAGTRCASRT